MGRYIGIDLGTTFSVAAYVDDDGCARIIDNQEGENITASAVFFDNGTSIVGTDAKKESVIDSKHFVGFVKRQMGKSYVKYNIDGRDYKPEEISAIILSKLKKDVELALGEEVLGAVITVPAYFMDAQRQATKDAARLAGLPVLDILNEPTAAALAYGISKNSDQKKKIMIYDLGGGTFDVSIMQFGGDKIEILSSMGDSELGGYDFDKQIVEWFTNEAEKDGVSIGEDKDAGQELLMRAEEAKKSLSTGRSKVKISVSVQGTRITKELTKEMFENMIGPILYQTISLMEEAMDEAGLQYEELDKILLVGGSTRIPLVASQITEETGIKPSQDIHPDEAVAIGAAYAAVECAKNPQKKKTAQAETVTADAGRASGSAVDAEEHIPDLGKQYEFIDRTSHSIGIVVLNDDGEEENSIVLPRNTRIPAETHQDYQTVQDYQEQLLIQVTQGEFTEIKNTTIVGDALLKLRPKPKGSPIRVVISCDESSLIHVHVIDLEDNTNLGEMRIERSSNMSDEEIKEAQQHLGKLNIGWED